jgi:hypothetical protein
MADSKTFKVTKLMTALDQACNLELFICASS